MGVSMTAYYIYIYNATNFTNARINSTKIRQ